MHYQIRDPQTMKPTFDANEQKKINCKKMKTPVSNQANEPQSDREYYNSRNPNKRNKKAKLTKSAVKYFPSLRRGIKGAKTHTC